MIKSQRQFTYIVQIFMDQTLFEPTADQKISIRNLKKKTNLFIKNSS